MKKRIEDYIKKTSNHLFRMVNTTPYQIVRNRVEYFKIFMVDNKVMKITFKDDNTYEVVNILDSWGLKDRTIDDIVLPYGSGRLNTQALFRVKSMAFPQSEKHESVKRIKKFDKILDRHMFCEYNNPLGLKPLTPHRI